MNNTNAEVSFPKYSCLDNSEPGNLASINNQPNKYFVFNVRHGVRRTKDQYLLFNPNIHSFTYSFMVFYLIIITTPLQAPVMFMYTSSIKKCFNVNNLVISE